MELPDRDSGVEDRRPALIAGNAVVLKPSDLAPLCALRMVEALDEAGVTKGAINLVTGPGSKVGAEIVENPAREGHLVHRIGNHRQRHRDRGSEARGRRVQLEMGGKNPTIVLADAQIPDAVNVVVNAAFFSTGQRCTATSRVIVEEPIVERFTAALVERTRALKVGNGLEAGIEIGPWIDDKQLATVLDYVGVGQTEGARVACGGARLSDGAYLPRLLLVAGRAHGCRAVDARGAGEIFGPVLAVLPARSLDQALEIANGIRYGLSAAICTTSLTSAYEFINRIEAGLVMVNLPSAGVEYHVPFGGSKQSSLGMREQGPVAVDFYSEIQTAYLRVLTGAPITATSSCSAPSAGSATSDPSTGWPSSRISRRPCITPSGLRTSIRMRVPSGRVRTAENPGQSAGMDGAIRSRVPARRSPSTDSTLTRYIHPATPCTRSSRRDRRAAASSTHRRPPRRARRDSAARCRRPGCG